MIKSVLTIILPLASFFISCGQRQSSKQNQKANKTEGLTVEYAYEKLTLKTGKGPGSVEIADFNKTTNQILLLQILTKTVHLFFLMKWQVSSHLLTARPFRSTLFQMILQLPTLTMTTTWIWQLPTMKQNI
jgi:hypothetical protein